MTTPKLAGHTPGPWTVEAGRSITTPAGSFFLSYGTDKHGNAQFRDFCALDTIAHAVGALPDLLRERDELRAALEAMTFALELESTRALAPYESAYEPLRRTARALLAEVKP